MSKSQDHSISSGGPDDAIRYELASLRYLDAYDRDDLDIMAQLWREAETDAKLEQVLCELNEGLLHEDHVQCDDSAQERVIGILCRSLPSAFAESPTLTVADVAAAIVTDRVTFGRLSAADRATNEKLLAVQAAVPAKLDGAAITSLQTLLMVTASQQYWRAFQQTAVLINMSRAGAGRAAARQARPPRPRRDEKGAS